MHSDVDSTLRALARLLAPYIAEELDRHQAALSPDYDESTCDVFVAELGTEVLRRLITLCAGLQMRDKVSSLELAAALEVASPRNISGALTTPLKRRARLLKLPLPFRGGEGALAYGGIPAPDPAADDQNRTYWQDRDGIAARLSAAAATELGKRGTPYPSKFIWEPGDLEVLSEDEVKKFLGGQPDR
jgi:hypothetical protein